jgi:hypothetical protein
MILFMIMNVFKNIERGSYGICLEGMMGTTKNPVRMTGPQGEV